MNRKNIPDASKSQRRILAFALFGFILSVSAPVHAREPLWGFTSFPYDISVKAVEDTWDTVLARSSFLPVHLDNCIPWHELESGRPMPAWLLAQWREAKQRAGSSRPVYVAITPMAQDRHSIAPACGATENETRKLPRSIRGARFDKPLIQALYLRYANLVIDALSPRYVNIGIEISELALSHPRKWPAFETLYRNTYKALKAKHATIDFGVELVLQTIMTPAIGNKLKPMTEDSDFICISFYPYAGAAGVAQGTVDLPRYSEQWREPLRWFRQWTDKPLAVCETGYSTKPFFLNTGGGIPFSGDEQSQVAFLKDLVDIARRDNYLFVTWFVSIDYQRLLAKLPDAPEWYGIWTYTGLFNADLSPKPALRHWPITARLPARASAKVDSDSMVLQLAPSAGRYPFQCYAGVMNAAPDNASIAHWKPRYEADWSWCAAFIDRGSLSDAKRVKFRARAQHPGALFVRVDLPDGRFWYQIIQVGRDWQDFDLLLAEFTDSLGGRSRLPLHDATSIVLADGAGVDGERGRQTWWLSPLSFLKD